MERYAAAGQTGVLTGLNKSAVCRAEQLERTSRWSGYLLTVQHRTEIGKYHHQQSDTGKDPLITPSAPKRRQKYYK
jgi:hypothetical protein